MNKFRMIFPWLKIKIMISVSSALIVPFDGLD